MLVAKELTGGGFEVVEISANIIKGQNIVFDGNFKSIVNSSKNVNIEINGTVKEFVANEGANITGKVEISKVTGKESAAVKINGKDAATQPTTPGGGSSSGGSNESSTVAVTGVTIAEKDFTLEIGEKKQLTASVVPSNATNKKVNWTSDNSSVAEVSSTGEVTAKATGKAVITVTTVSGGKTDSVTVAVKSRLPEVIVEASKVEASKITTESALTATQIENSEKLDIDLIPFDDGSYKIILNADAALKVENGEHKTYFILSLKGGESYLKLNVE